MEAPQLPGYDVLGPMGAGGSADVWRARRRADGLAVALKVVRPARGDVEAALAEAGLLAGVRHPHVVHLYDVLPVPADGPGQARRVVLVTQLAAGGSLAQVLAHRHLLSPGEVVTVLHPVSSALAALHRGGVVHGDLSTGNIVFRSDGMPLLADLGTARVTGEEGLRGVGTGAADGLVAPEVVEGFAATRESDVYQVGALAWLCLVGAPPGPGFDRPPLAEVAPDLSPVVLDLVQRCLAPQPEDRPDADEVAAALLEVAAPEPVEVAPDADPAHGVTQRLRQVALADDAEQAPRRRWWQRSGRPQPGEGARSSRPARRRAGAHRARHGGTADDEGGAAPETEGALPLVRWVTVAMGLAVVAMLGLVLWPAAGPAQQPDGPAQQVSGETTPAVADGEVGADSDGEGGLTEGGAGVPRADAASVTTAAPAGAEASPESLDGQQAPPEDQDRPGTSPDGPALRSHVQELLNRRAAAWQSADPGLLAGVVAPGSEAESSETTQLEAARASGTTYDQVSFDLVELEVTREGENTMEVEAVITRSPVEVARGGEVVLEEPARTDRVRVELARSRGSWLLAAWG